MYLTATRYVTRVVLHMRSLSPFRSDFRTATEDEIFTENENDFGGLNFSQSGKYSQNTLNQQTIRITL